MKDDSGVLPCVTQAGSGAIYWEWKSGHRGFTRA